MLSEEKAKETDISCTPPQKVILYQCLKVTIQSIHVLMPIHETD